jgi:uncharacterized protein (DUF885 family)
MKAVLPILLALATLALVATSARAQRNSDEEFDTVAEAFLDRYFDFYPTAAMRAGLHDYDGRLGDRSAAAIEAYLADIDAFEKRLLAVAQEGLSPDQQVDRVVILRQIDRDQFWLEELATWRSNPRYYAGQMDLTFLLLLDYAPLEKRMVSIVERLEQFPSLVAAARANIDTPPRPFIETALITYRGLPNFLEKDLVEALASVDDPELQQRFQRAMYQAAAALNDYAYDLETRLDTPPFGEFAMGAESYRRMNAHLSVVDLPLDQLKAIGEEELARLRNLAYELALEITGDVENSDRDAVVLAAFDAIGLDQPAPEEIVSSAADVIGDLRRFVDETPVGTVLPGDVEVREIPPFRRTNFAYIFIPGPFETAATTGFYFIQPVEENWSEAVKTEFLTRNNDWAILNTSGHEAYPGHYHHYNHINRAPTRAQQLLTAYVTTEGWAHYGEEMSWRQGLGGGGPKLGLAVVQDALLRVVRYLASIGLHTEGMSVETAEEMFHRVAYQDSVNARQQALRGTYDPEYLNYTLGKLMILRLRDDARAEAEARGEPFDLKAFHDDFMSRGAPAVPWIGRRMLNDPEWQPFR